MGQFKSGVWIIGLFIYFTTLFLIVFCVSESVPDSGVQYTDPGYGSSTNKPSNVIGATTLTADVSTDNPSMGSILTTISIITSVGSGNYQIGIPAAWNWLFSFIFFYLPLAMLVWAIYMAIPVIH